MNSILECPVLYPTKDQFADFYSFIQKVEDTYKKDYGMVKIVPPKGWTPRDQNYELIKKQMKIRKPIEQLAKMKKNDFYEIHNIISDNMNMSQFQKNVADKNSIKQTNSLETENQFWKTVKYSPPIYGADLNKSLMSENAGDWNLGKLNSLLWDAAPVLIKGVTFPYVYVGSWKSLFCWHKEDLDLAAINYLHQGAVKNWYCIQKNNSYILQEQAKKTFPEIHKSCNNFMRHKTTLINPYKLKELHPELKITKAYQKPNQFVVAFGGSYHCGFNTGKNIAEAVNFATKSWLQDLQGVNYCMCTPSSVRPDYKYFIENLLRGSLFFDILGESKFRKDPAVMGLKDWAIENKLFVNLGSESDSATEDINVKLLPVTSPQQKLQKAEKKEKKISKKLKSSTNKSSKNKRSQSSKKTNAKRKKLSI